MEAPSNPPPPARRNKFVVGAGIVVLTLCGLVAWAMGRPGSTSFFYTPTEVMALGVDAPQGEYRVNGKVLPDTVEGDPDGLTTTFEIHDGATEMRVTTDSPLPDAFWTAMANDSSEVEIVARGRYSDGIFTASQVLAKCPSKFKAKVAAGG
ncbi:MAG: CcmE [Actinomycetota bacterium]|jgi:cytochrome c-type biogenesis protein CcmE|nr:CcmE [Actinomycetota bacterium]